MLTKQEKNQVIDRLLSDVKESASIVFTRYQGMKTEELLDLRAKLRPTQGQYKVVKNTFSKRAFQLAKIEGVEAHIQGPTALVLNKSDLVTLAKVLSVFSKDHENFKIKAAYGDGRFYTAEDLKALALLPPREVLLAKVVGMIKSPLTRLRGALESPLRGLVMVLDAISKKKQ